MISVSDEYKRLANANGREVSCVIEVGELEFGDADIISFEFDDVVHPDEMTFGTTCSNRFHFEVITDEYIPLSSVVKPYIMFVGCDERVCLGTFYIARRYRRRNRYSITCYDKMYQLDSLYETALVYPQSMQAVLDDICSQLSLTTDIVCRGYDCGAIPLNATYRDMIGFIAGAHGGAAKFSRDNILTLKRLDDCSETITRDNYTDISVKEDVFEVRQINIIVDEETTLSSGDGTRLTTYVQENPFGTQIMCERLFEAWNGFSYYGAEIEMQGLPYLEAGDIISVQNDVDNSVLPVIISELNFVYDGGFSATLCSRSKNPVDDYDTHLQDDTQSEEIYNNLSVVNFSVRNSTARTAGSELKTLMLAMDINATEPKNALLDAMLVVTASEDCVLTLTCDLNGADLYPSAQQALHADMPHTICLHNILDDIHNGENAITVWGKTSAGTAVMDIRQGVMTVSGQYMNASDVINRPDYTAVELFPLITVRPAPLSPMFGEGNISAEIPDDNVTIGFEESGFTTPANRESISTGFTAAPFFGYAFTASSEDFSTVEVRFTNPVSSADLSACTAAFTVSFTDGTDNYTLYAASLQWLGGNVIGAVFPSFAAAISDITLSYLSQAGNLTETFSGTAIESFGIAVEIITE